MSTSDEIKNDFIKLCQTMHREANAKELTGSINITLSYKSYVTSEEAVVEYTVSDGDYPTPVCVKGSSITDICDEFIRRKVYNKVNTQKMISHTST